MNILFLGKTPKGLGKDISVIFISECMRIFDNYGPLRIRQPRCQAEGRQMQKAFFAGERCFIEDRYRIIIIIIRISCEFKLFHS